MENIYFFMSIRCTPVESLSLLANVISEFRIQKENDRIRIRPDINSTDFSLSIFAVKIVKKMLKCIWEKSSTIL